jgi:hypothetical protein
VWEKNFISLRGIYSDTVVRYFYFVKPAAPYVNFNALRAGVERIFRAFFNNRGRIFNNLAGGKKVEHRRR